MVGQLVCDELVPPGELLAGEPEQDPVHGAEVVKVARVVHLLVQLHIEGHLAELLVTPVNAPLHQRVAESELLLGYFPQNCISNQKMAP